MNASVDPTSVAILPADAPYLANLAALWAVDPVLARRIEAIDEAALHEIALAKSGDATVVVAGQDGRRIWFHSRYQPAEEAARAVPVSAFEGAYVFFLQGMGLGYTLEHVFRHASDESIICLFEPDLIMLATAMWHRDLSSAIQSGRLLIFNDADKGLVFHKLIPHVALVSAGHKVIPHAPSVQLNAAYFDRVNTWIGELGAYTDVSISTLVANGKRTAENVSRNLGWYAATPGIGRLKDAYAGKPAIIVSAGPSLRRNRHLLKDARNHACMIAVQTTFQPLLEMGIEPHFVTSLDYHTVSTRFFEKIPAKVSTQLVAEPKATSEIFEMHAGPVSLLGNDYAEAVLREMKLNRPRLASGATVAHLAFYLAEHLGCDPVIFVGQDLGFSDGLCYMPGTSYEDVWRPELSRFCTVEMKQWEMLARDRHILRRIPDWSGNPMYTEARLFTYLQQFERDFALTRRKVIDATEGGARKAGAEAMKLADALATYCQAPLADVQLPEEPLRWDRLPACIESLQKRAHEAQQVERISRETLPLLEEIRNNLTDQPRVNRAIARIDVLHAQMNECNATYELVTQLTQQSQLQRFKADLALAAARLDGIEKQRRQVDRDIGNVGSVADAAADFKGMMLSVSDELAVLHERKSKRGAR